MRKNNISRRRRNELVFICLVLAWPILHFVVYKIAMNVSLLSLSFQNGSISSPLTFVAWDNYKDVFKMIAGTKTAGNNNPSALWNALTLIPLSLIINMPITLVFSFAIFRKFKGHAFFRVALFVPSMISAVVLCLLFKILVSNKGVLNPLLELFGAQGLIPMAGWFGSADTAWGMILVFSVWTGISSNIIYFCSAMSRVPSSVIESSQLDGATELRIFMQMVVPLVWPTISTMVVTGFVGCFSWFMPALLLTQGGPDGVTSTLGLIITQTTKNSSSNMGFAAALGVVISVIGSALVFSLRWLMSKVYAEVEY